MSAVAMNSGVRTYAYTTLGARHLHDSSRCASTHARGRRGRQARNISSYVVGPSISESP